MRHARAGAAAAGRTWGPDAPAVGTRPAAGGGAGCVDPPVLEGRPASRLKGRGRLARVVELVELMGPNCHYCAVDLDLDNVTLDHVWPYSLGGWNGLANLVLACWDCNQSLAATPIKCLCARCRRVWLPIVQSRLRHDLRFTERRSR